MNSEKNGSNHLSNQGQREREREDEKAKVEKTIKEQFKKFNLHI